MNYESTFVFFQTHPGPLVDSSTQTDNVTRATKRTQASPGLKEFGKKITLYSKQRNVKGPLMQLVTVTVYCFCLGSRLS